MKLRFPVLGALFALALFTVVACGGGATATPEAATQQAATPEAATQLTPEQQEDAFTDALNSGNLAAFNDILADDFVFTQVPGPGGTERVTVTGKSAYMIRLAGLIENNQQLTLSEQVYEGDNSSGKFSATADNLKAIGVDSLTGTFTATSKDGKVVSLDTVVDQASLAKLGAATAPPSAEQVVNAYMTALNGGNLDAIVELYADDIVFTFGPLPLENNFQTLTGKAENLADDADTITNNGQLLFSRTSEAGNTVKGEFSYTDDELKGFGVATITGTFESVVEQGKITSMKGLIDEKTQQLFAAAFAPPASRELTLLVGAGRDTVAINGFFPSKATVRAGDTVVWKQNSDEIHTVAFFPAAQDLVAQEIIPVPGGGPTDLMLNPQIAFPTRAPGAPVETFSGTGLVNSGIMSKGLVAPGAEAFTLVLDTPGTYEYVCLIHPFSMRGTVIVEPSSVGDVPSQADIDAAAQAELAPLQAQITRLGEFRDSGKATWSEAGPNGTTIWHLQAGGIGRDHRVELIDFLAKDITIQEGDTVVWTASAFHQVTFHPGRTEPIFVVPVPQDQGPPNITLNPEVLFPAKPAAEFDGTGFWSSGILDIGLGPAGFTPGGSTFSMTFGKTGVFDYICAVHIDLGMEGTITVVERQAPPVAVFNATAGEFPEGLAVDQDGNIYAGLALTGEIRRYTPAGEETSFAQLPAPGQGFMVGMEFDQAGDLFVAMTSFDAETHGIWRVSPDGSSELFASLPVDGLPNVPVFNGAGDLFVSDTIGGAVWKINPDGNVTTWIQDPLLLGNIPPGAMGFPIGSNGVAFDVDENHLYIAVTEKARIVRIAVNVDGSAGAAEVFAEDQSSLAGPDGIAFGASGDLYVALAGSDAIAVISPEGEVSTLLAGGSLQNPSDIKFGIGDDANTLYIANFAIFRMLGFIPGTPQPALLKMQVDSP